MLLFYVTAVTLLVIFFMNESTNYVNPTYFQSFQMSIIKTNYGMFCILTFLKWKIVISDWNVGENYLASGSNSYEEDVSMGFWILGTIGCPKSSICPTNISLINNYMMVTFY